MRDRESRNRERKSPTATCRVGKRKFSKGAHGTVVARKVDEGNEQEEEEEERRNAAKTRQERAIYGRRKKIGAADIRERGQLAAVAIPTKSYGEIDRRKSSRRRERNYVFVDAYPLALSLSLTSAFSADRAGNSGGGNGADPEFVAGKIPDNYTAGMLSAAEPRDTFLPRRVLSLTVAPHAVDR